MKEISHITFLSTYENDIESIFHNIDLSVNIHSVILYKHNIFKVRYKRHQESPRIKHPTNDQLCIIWKKTHVYINNERIWFLSNNDIQHDINFIEEIRDEILIYVHTYSELLQTDYRYITIYSLRKIWNIHIFAHVISTDSKFRQYIAYSETQQPISAKVKKMMRVKNSRVVITINTTDNYTLSIRMSNLEKGEYDEIYELLRNIFKYYDENYERIYPLYHFGKSPKNFICNTPKTQSHIGYLRMMDPDFFISGYSRESPVLPILIPTAEEASTIKSLVIRYPMDTGYYYTAPDGYFVSLKKNRLKNKDKYPYLVNCYKENHVLKPGSNLYRYYHPDSIPESRTKKITNIPSNLNLDCHAHCERIDKLDNEYDIQADIIILEADSSNLASIVIPKHINKYIWRRKYDRCILIIQEYKGAYGMKTMTNNIVVHGTDYFFTYKDHPAVVRLAEMKENYDEPVVEGIRQYVDENDKCVVVWTENGEEKECYQEPLNVPVCQLNDVSELIDDVKEAFRLGIINRTQYLNFTERTNECYF